MPDEEFAYVSPKLTKEQFIEVKMRAFGSRWVENLLAKYNIVPCYCDDLYCQGWRLERKEELNG